MIDLTIVVPTANRSEILFDLCDSIELISKLTERKIQLIILDNSQTVNELTEKEFSFDLEYY